MKTISLVVLFTLALSATCLPSSRDLLQTYGNAKVSSIVSQRTIDFIKRFTDINPQVHEDFKRVLASQGVYLPEYADLKWNIITQEDFDNMKKNLGDVTFLEALNDKYFLRNLQKTIENDPAQMKRLSELYVEAGITDNGNVDLAKVAKALEQLATPALFASFTPIAMQILYFGKRDLIAEENRIDLSGLLSNFVNKKVSSIVSERSVEFLKRFTDINPKYYQELKSLLTHEGVTMPEYADLKWDILTQKDFDDFNAILGDVTFGEALKNPYFFAELIEKVENNYAFMDRLDDLYTQFGFSYSYNTDPLNVFQAFEQLATPAFFASFAPIAMQILYFGK